MQLYIKTSQSIWDKNIIYKGMIKMFNRFRRCYFIKRRCEKNNEYLLNCQKNCNRETLNINEIDYNALLQKVKDGGILIDVRTRQEFLEGHLEGAILIPYYEIRKKIVNIIPTKEQCIVLYCQNGGRSVKAYEVLKKIGYSNLYNLKGGLEVISYS